MTREADKDDEDDQDDEDDEDDKDNEDDEDDEDENTMRKTKEINKSVAGFPFARKWPTTERRSLE